MTIAIGIVAAVGVAGIGRVGFVLIGMIRGLGRMRRRIPRAADLSDGRRGNGE